MVISQTPFTRSRSGREPNTHTARAPIGHDLGGGRMAIIRPARPGDRETYVQAVASMSPRSYYQRFFSRAKSLPDRDVDRLMDLRVTRQAVWLAIEAETGRGIGAARYAMIDPETAEVAIGITDADQGRGLGGVMLDRVILGARERGLVRLRAESLQENTAIAALLGSRGFHAAGQERGVIMWDMPLNVPTLASAPDALGRALSR